jgi:catechol 2,3-dioxygenase-like lactoylglutathione lyase family enzyme
MAVSVLELHHHAMRIPPGQTAQVQDFYENVLGFEADPTRPSISTIPGAWMHVGRYGTSQVHLIGVGDGPSPIAQDRRRDPARPHIALAVDDIEVARKELERLEVPHWVFNDVPNMALVFLEDPAGNMIELHQAGTCSCNRAATAPPDER